MKKDVLMYSNNDGAGQRIIRDFLAELCLNIKSELTSPQTMSFINAYRILNERELAGVFIKSCSNIQEDKEAFIATELQVKRKINSKLAENGDNSLGRVDFMVNYRNISFLIELKVARIAVNSKKSPAPTDISKELMPWIKVCEQLESLDPSSLGNALGRKFLKIPILIYFYVSPSSCEVFEDIEQKVISKHTHLMSIINSNHNVKQNVTFEFVSNFDKTVISHRRRSSAIDNVDTTNLYGFSIVAAEIKN